MLRIVLKTSAMSCAVLLCSAVQLNAGEFTGTNVIFTSATASLAGATSQPGAIPLIHQQLSALSSPTLVTASGPLKTDQLIGNVSASVRSHTLPGVASAVGHVQQFNVSGGLPDSPSALNMSLVADQLFAPSADGLNNGIYAETRVRFNARIAPGDVIKYSVSHSISLVDTIYTFTQQGIIDASGESTILLNDSIPQPHQVLWTEANQVDTFRQAVGMSFQIFSNSASSTGVEDVQLFAALTTSPNVQGTLGPVGDFDRDLQVDGGDFLTWQRQFNTSVVPLTGADGDGNGLVEEADLALWKSHFGEVAASESAAVTVPEPSLAVLSLPATAAAWLVRRRPIRSSKAAR